MKQLTKLTLLAIVFLAVSCSKNAGELIKGTWTFEKIEILNHDELIKQQLETSTIQIEKDIEKIKKQIDESKDEALKEVLEASLTQYETALKELPERAKEAKENTQKSFEALIGKATFTFTEDFKCERKLSVEDITMGTWRIEDGNKAVFISEEFNGEVKEIRHEIEEISSDKLVLIRVEENNDITMKMRMELKK